MYYLRNILFESLFVSLSFERQNRNSVPQKYNISDLVSLTKLRKPANKTGLS